MPSPFTWLDLLTPDAPGARARLADVLGLAPVGPAVIGGLGGPDGPRLGVQALPEEEAPHALGQVIVEDVGAACARVAFLGGQVLLPPEHVDGYGDTAVIATSPRSVVALLAPRGWAPPSERGPGHVGWSLLVTPDAKADATALRAAFGWRLDGRVLVADGEPFGALIEAAALPDVPPQWLHLVRVADLAAAIARADARDMDVVAVEDGRGAVAVDEDGLAFGMWGG